MGRGPTALLVAAAVAIVVLIAALAAPRGEAAFPGKPGKIAFSSARAPHPGDDEIYIMSNDGTNQLRLTTSVGDDNRPSFSPDGRKIVFRSDRAPHAGDNEIYVINVDGTGLRRLTTHPADDVSPTWSPSGAQIAFASDRTGRPQIYTMNADGTGVERLTLNESEADRPTWSPAPYNEMAFTARTGSWYDIKKIDMATRQVTQITFSQGSNESPAFSPTGRHLAFTSTRTGSKQIFLIGRDGRGLKQVTRQGNNQTPSWSSH